MSFVRLSLTWAWSGAQVERNLGGYLRPGLRGAAPGASTIAEQSSVTLEAFGGRMGFGRFVSTLVLVLGFGSGVSAKTQASRLTPVNSAALPGLSVTVIQTALTEAPTLTPTPTPTGFIPQAPAPRPVVPEPSPVSTVPIAPPPRPVVNPSPVASPTKVCTACLFEQQRCGYVTIGKDDGTDRAKMKKCQGYPFPSQVESSRNMPNPKRSHCFYDSTTSKEFPYGFCYSGLKRECEELLAKAAAEGNPTKLDSFAPVPHPDDTEDRSLETMRKKLDAWFEQEKAAGRCSELKRTENRHGITGSLVSALAGVQNCPANKTIHLDTCSDGALTLDQLRKIGRQITGPSGKCKGNLTIRANQCTTSGNWNGGGVDYIFSDNSCTVRLDSCADVMKNKCITGHPGASVYGWCAEEGSSVCMVCNEPTWSKVKVDKPGATAAEQEDANRQPCIDSLRTQPPKLLKDSCFNLFDAAGVGGLKKYNCENACSCVYGVGTGRSGVHVTGVVKSRVEAYDEDDAISQLSDSNHPGGCYKICSQAVKDLGNYSSTQGYPFCKEVK